MDGNFIMVMCDELMCFHDEWMRSNDELIYCMDALNDEWVCSDDVWMY